MTEFWHMDGYGLFVWGSYAAGAAVFVWNLLAPRRQRRAILKRIAENP